MKPFLPLIPSISKIREARARLWSSLDLCEVKDSPGSLGIGRALWDAWKGFETFKSWRSRESSVAYQEYRRP